MRNYLIPVSVGLLCTSFTVIPSGSLTKAAAMVNTTSKPEQFSLSIKNTGTALYNAVSLQQYGLPEEAFNYAWKGYDRLAAENKIKRSRYLTICDFSQSSKNKRLYIIDVEEEKLVTNTYVAHGKNSGGEFAKKFSNIPESLQSSLGFYITAQTYTGEHGLSLRINGVDPGYNNKAFERNIVIHGAEYVDAARSKAGIMMGRSFGCPAVPQNESREIINTIKNGTCLFIYHPDRNYLLHSKILND